MLRNKIIVKKLRNIFILFMAIIIMFGAYRNIRNSRAENVIQIELEVADKSEALEPQIITIDATENEDGNYIIDLPKSVNELIVTKYYIDAENEINMKDENAEKKIELTSEEITSKKVQITTDYDTKEATEIDPATENEIENAPTVTLYNKELIKVGDENGNGKGDVIVTGYMPLDAQLEVTDIDLNTLKNLELENESQTLQKAYEVSVFQEVEKQKDETNVEQENTATEENAAEQEQTEIEDTTNTESEKNETEETDNEIEKEKVEYNPSIYGEALTIKTKNTEQDEISLIYSLPDDIQTIKDIKIEEMQQEAELENISGQEYVCYTTEKTENIIKYMLVTEPKPEESVEPVATTSGTLKSTSTEISNTSGFLGNTSIQRQNIENVTFVNSTSGANSTKWDVSSAGDGSVLAWYETSNSNGALKVYIGCNGTLYANADSTGLFAYIGYASICTATETITNIELLNVSNVTNMMFMFKSTGYAAMINLDLGDNFDTSNVTNMSSMFMDTGSAAMTSLNLGDKFDTSNVTDMYEMFYCTGYDEMTSLNLRDKFDTSNVTDMGSMFYQTGYTAMTSLDLGEKFDTSNVTNMENMFGSTGCLQMTSLNLGNKFRTSKVEDMGDMFADYTFSGKGLIELNLGDNFDTSNVTDMDGMFFYLIRLEALYLGQMFTNISENNDDMFFCVGMNCENPVVYAPSAIYYNSTHFKLGANSTDTIELEYGTIQVIKSTTSYLATTNTETEKTSGFLGNTNIQRQNIENVTLVDGGFSEITAAHNYNAKNNRGTSHSSTTKTWKDTTGSQNGTLTGGTWGSDYLSLDGTDDWVNLGQMSFSNNQVAIEATISANEIQSGVAEIVSNIQTGGLSLYLYNGKPRFRVYSEEQSTYINVSATSAVTVGEKNVIRGMYDGKNLMLFLNGELIAKKAHEEDLKTPGSSTVMAIGANPKGSSAEGNYANINVYDVKIYDNVWDVSAEQDGSILAWNETSNSNGAQKVYIGSDNTIGANEDSSYLFAWVGYSENCTATEAITNLNLLNTSKTTNMSRMFRCVGYRAMTSLDLGNFDTSNVTSMYSMFSNTGYKKMTSFSLGTKFDTSKVTKMAYMFYRLGYESLPSLTLEEGFDTSQVTNMNYMFQEAGYVSMTSLKLGDKFNTSNVTTMSYMFTSTGKTAMTTLDLGPAFTNIASTNTDIFTEVGKTGSLVIQAAESIYSTSTKFKLNASSSTTLAITTGTINPKYKTEWVKESFSVEKTTDNKAKVNIKLRGTTNTAVSASEYTSDVTGVLTKSTIKILIDGTDVTNILTTTIGSATQTTNSTTGAKDVVQTITLTDFEQAGIPTGKSYKEWSGNIKIEVTKGILTDKYGNKNIASTISTTTTNQNSTSSLFVDVIAPTVIFKNSNTVIDEGDKSIKLEFDITDKYYSSSNTNLTLNDITIKIDGEVPDWTEITRTLRVEPLTATVDGSSEVVVGRRYSLILSNLEQLQIKEGDKYLDYSGIITVAIPAGKAKDYSSNSNVATTITTGIDLPESTGTAEVIDIVTPQIIKTSSTYKAGASEATIVLQATDKYFSSSTLTTDIATYVNGAQTTSVSKTVTKLDLTETRSENGTTSTVKYGEQVTLKLSSIPTDADQIKIVIPKGTVTDKYGNTNEQTEFLLMNSLRKTNTETGKTSGFLGNTSIERQNIENVTFVDGGLSKATATHSYNAVNNTGNGQNIFTYTWKDLNGNADGTVKLWESVSQDQIPVGGAIWGEDYLEFDGVDDWVNLGEMTFTNKIVIDTTISINSIQSGEVEVICNYESGGVGIHLTDGIPKFQIYSSEAGKYISASGTEALKIGEKTHLTGMYDGKNVMLFINGILTSKVEQEGTIKAPSSNTVMAIGTNPNGSTAKSGFANMKVYDVKIYDNVWDVSAAEDGSILAWSETGNSDGAQKVYIGSDYEIYGNKDSSYLFSYIADYSTDVVDECITNINLLNTSIVTDMSYMFSHLGEGCIKKLDLGNNFDTNKVTNMKGMFSATGYYRMTELNLGSKFNTSNVTDMSYMFENTGRNAMTSLDLGDKFDTSNVTDMYSMFCYTGYTALTNLDLGDKFDTSNVTNMSCMFKGCGYTVMTSLDLGDKFDTSNVTTMQDMFRYTGYTTMTSLNLGDKFNTSNVTDMLYMFYMTGTKEMTSLDLGPAFTQIASTKSGDSMFYNTGKSGTITIYASEPIYSGQNKFKLNADATESAINFTRGTINPKYRTEWTKENVTIDTTDASNPKINVQMRGTTNTEVPAIEYASDVTGSLTKSKIKILIDGTDVTDIITTTLGTATQTTNESGTKDILQTVTLTDLEETARRTGKNYREWSGNIAVEVLQGTLTDTYGNSNMDVTSAGERTDNKIEDETKVDKNTDGAMFSDVIKPEITYTYSDGDINTTNDTVTVEFTIADKYLNNISTVTTDQIKIKLLDTNTQIPDDKITKTLTKVSNITETREGFANAVKVGEKYKLVISGLDQIIIEEGNNYKNYSGPMSITFPAGLATDKSGNTSIAKTITIGIDEETWVSASSIYDSTGNDSDKLHIGDFVNYDAGTWTTDEIKAIKVGPTSGLVSANSSTSLPTSNFQFGGFTVGSSRNGNATPYSSSYNFVKDKSTNTGVTGWRVFDVDGNTVTLISAGNTEDYYHPYATNQSYGYISEYILTGNVNSNWSSTSASSYQKRDWSIYVNSEQNATSATVLTKSRLDDWYKKYTNTSNANTYTSSTFQKIYSGSYTKYQNMIENYTSYWLSEACTSNDMYYVNPKKRYVGGADADYGTAIGVRMLITLSADAQFYSTKTGTKTVTGGNTTSYGGDQTYNVWNLYDSSENTTTVDVVNPTWEETSKNVDITNKTASITIEGTDKYYKSNSLTKDKLIVLADGDVVTGATISLSSATNLTEQRKEGNQTSTVQYGVKYTISVSELPTEANQACVRIPSGTLTDESGNVNPDIDIIIYSTLKETKTENENTSGFLGNTSIERQNIDNVTFMDNVPVSVYNKVSKQFKNSTAWDVSENQDKSIIAWYETNANGTLKVYIGSDGAIFGNQDSSYLFANIGCSSDCTATETITDINLLNTSKVTNMSYMFYKTGAETMRSLDLGNNFKTNNVTNMSHMFDSTGVGAMTSLELGEEFDTSNVTDMSYMFYTTGAMGVTSLDLGDKFDTSKVTNMKYMFYSTGLYSLYNLNLGTKFNTSNVTNMSYMFGDTGYNALTSLSLGEKFNTSKVTNMTAMFSRTGYNTMTSLDLGPAFTQIASANGSMFSNTGKSGSLVVNAPESIFENETNFKLGSSSTTTIELTTGTIKPKYKTEWVKESTTISTTNKNIQIQLRGTTNPEIEASEYTSNVTSALTADKIKVLIDGTDITNVVTKTIGTATTATNTKTGATDVLQTVTISNFEEVSRRTGKSYIEWSGNITIEVGQGTATDKYGNSNVEVSGAGAREDNKIYDTTSVDKNTTNTMFTDFIKPEFTYIYADDNINITNQTVTVEFSIIDKYFSSVTKTALNIADEISIKLIDTPTMQIPNEDITKTLTKIGDVTETRNGTSVKIGEKYRLVVGGLQQEISTGKYKNYSGPMSVTFPEGIAKDKSGNTNISKTITIGIDSPDNSGEQEIVDVVKPTWKLQNYAKNTTTGTITVDLVGTDKYYESNTLTTSGIKLLNNGTDITSSVSLALGTATALTETRNGSQVQYGVKYQLTITGVSTGTTIETIRISAGTLKDKSGNLNDDNDLMLYSTLMATNTESSATSGFLGNANIQRQNIENITFVNTIADANDTVWDVSEAQNGSILAWYETSNSNGALKVYIGSEGEISANTDSSYLFAYIGYSSKCTAREAITNINLLNVSGVTNMSYMFTRVGYNGMSSLDLGDNFITTNVTNMNNMFAYTGYTAMASLNLGDNFDTSNVTTMEYMFYYTGYKGMTTLDLGDVFYTTNVTNMDFMFRSTGAKAMTTLDLGPAFTRMVDSVDIFDGTGTTSLIIKAPESIYSNKKYFKEGPDSNTTIPGVGTIEPVYRTEWELNDRTLVSTTSEGKPKFEFTLTGRTNSWGTVYTSDVTSVLTKENMTISIDGTDITDIITVTIGTAKQVNGFSPNALELEQTITLTDFEQVGIPEGKSFKEWSGNIKVELKQRTLLDKYGNGNVIVTDSGERADQTIETDTVSQNYVGSLFIDKIVPEVIYINANTEINNNSKSVKLVFDITDKYYKSSNTKLTLNDLTIKIDGENPDWTEITKSLQTENISATVDGSTKVVGVKYTLTLSDLEQLQIKDGDKYLDYSGVITVAIPAGVATDNSSNSNVATTITTGIDLPESTGTAEVVDVVKPLIEKIESRLSSYASVTFRVTDKYFDNCNLTAGANTDIKIVIDGTESTETSNRLLRKTKDLTEERTENGTTSTVKYGEEYSLDIVGLSGNESQIKVIIPAGIVTDKYGNTNNQTELMVFNTLATTNTENSLASGFLGNASIERQDIENVTFVNGGLSNATAAHSYNATKNTGSSYSSTTKTWKDLNGSMNGTVNGATWNNDHLKFDGVDDWVNLGKMTFTNQVLIDVTISINSIQSGEVEVICNYESGGLGISLTDGIPKFQIYSSEAGKYISASGTEALKIGEKTRLTGMYDGKNVMLFINGTLTSKVKQEGTIKAPANNTVIAIGANPSESTSNDSMFANINVYDLKIYNNIWDVSAAEDGSILAWNETSNSNGAQKVYISSESEIYGNIDSSYLFAFIGYEESCTATETISNIDLLNVKNVKDMSYMFMETGAMAMTSFDLGDNFDTNKVTNMEGMFCGTGYTAMTSLNLGEKFDTSNVTNMKLMFSETGAVAMTSLNLREKFDTSNVTNMESMFCYTGAASMTNLNLGEKFDTSNVTNMESMFVGTGYTVMTSLDLGDKFNTSNVTNMSYMFNNTGYMTMTSLNLGDKFDTSNVTNMSSMFAYTGYTAMTSLNLGEKFYTNSATNMNSIFWFTGHESMTSLDLGPAFTKISGITDYYGENPFGSTGKTGEITVYVSEQIYQNISTFKLDANSSTTIVFKEYDDVYDQTNVIQGMIEPKYRTEWVKASTTIDTTDASNPKINIQLKGTTNEEVLASEYASDVTSALTTSKIKISIDGTDITNIVTKTLGTATTATNERTGATDALQTLTISNFEEVSRRTGKNYKEWSGNIVIEVGQGTATDAYGNSNMKVTAEGERTDNKVYDETKFDKNTTDAMFADFIKPEITYVYADDNVDMINKTLTVEFTVIDKYFDSIELSATDEITVKLLDENVQIPNDKITKTITKVSDVTESRDGSTVVIGTKYQLVISGLQQQTSTGNYKNYSGPMSITLPEGIATDKSGNTNIAKTITIGVNDPDGDSDNQQIVDVVDPIWKADNINIDNNRKLLKVDLIGTDKYYASNSLTTDKINIYIDGTKLTTTTNVVKTLSEATALTETRNGTETQYGVRYTLTISNWEEAVKQTGKDYYEWSGTTKIEILADTLTDQFGNTSKLQELELGHVDLIKPKVEKVSSTKDATAKTETIIFNVIDKYFETSQELSADNIKVYVDKEETTGITKTLTKLSNITATVNGSSTIIGQQYKVVVSNFEQARTSINADRNYTDWSGTVSIDVLEGAIKDTSDNTNETTTIDGDFVDFINPEVTYKYSSSDINYDRKTFTMELEIVDKYFAECTTLTTANLASYLTIKVDGEDITNNTKVKKEIIATENVTAGTSANPMNKTIDGTVETGLINQTIGKHYTLKLSNLEQTIKTDEYMDYSGVITVAVKDGIATDTSNNTNIATTITSGVDFPGGSGTGVIVDVVDPVWELVGDVNVDMSNKTASLVVKGSDKYLDKTNSVLTTDNIKIKVTNVNGVAQTSGITISVTEDTSVSLTYGRQYNITVSGFEIDEDQVKIILKQGSLIDESGNTNKDTEFMIYNTLQRTFEETEVDSAFLGNTSIQRQNIENVTFVNNTSGANETKWDVSSVQDGSILAWYETSNSNGALKVYIGSDSAIFGNNYSACLFKNIGYSSICTATETITNLNLLNTSNVCVMSEMFAYTGYNAMEVLDLGNNFDTSNATTMRTMFSDTGYNKMTTLKLGSKFNTENVTITAYMFLRCGYKKLETLDLGDKFDTSNVTDMNRMFTKAGCESLTTLKLGNKFDTRNATIMGKMFNCTGMNTLELLDLGDKFDTSNVTNMEYMFAECNALTGLNLGSKFNTANVTTMESMFAGTGSTSNKMTSLDLGDKFSTANVTNMTNMFNGCGKTAMTVLDLGTAFTKIAEEHTGMFTDCGTSNLVIYSPEKIYSNKSEFKLGQ